MKVFNEDKTQVLTSYDLSSGYLENDTLTIHHEAEIIHHEAEIIHHEAVEGVEEQGHYETIAEYPNGGKDVEYIIDVKGVEAKEAYDEIVKEAYDEIVKEAYDEVEPIYRYIPYSEAEKNINALKSERATIENWLRKHDYIGVKIATGRATKEEYATEIAEMTEKANRINEIDTALNNL